MLNAVTLFASEEAPEGIGALGISASSFVIQLITFVLAYLVLRKFAFGPILKILQQRRETIDSGVRLGEEMRKEKSRAETTIANELQKARKQADEIISDADIAAREAQRAAEEKAQEKADVIVKEGKVRAEQEVVRARKALEAELVGLVSEATEAIIGEKVDAKKDAALIDKALKEQRA